MEKASDRAEGEIKKSEIIHQVHREDGARDGTEGGGTLAMPLEAESYLNVPRISEIELGSVVHDASGFACIIFRDRRSRNTEAAADAAQAVPHFPKAS